ncbi:MAG: MBL fold metallo-hydrolase [Methanotrichaceae archaeon]|nr:MBL fold metallo-hydrolase [Methanotrichaceae archaeon]
MSKAKAVCDRVYVVGGSGLSAPEDAFVYLVDAGSELVLIDAGVGYGAGRIEDNIRSLGWQPAQVWHIIATHCHIDHIGGLFDWKERYGSKIIAHELDRAGIEGENNKLTAASMYGVDYKPVKVDTILKGGAEKLILGDLEFNFLHTPGHTPGSISVYIDTKDGRVLFGQDIHGPFSDAWGSDLAQWRASMHKLLDLRADVLCEGHAGIYRGEKIGKYIEGYLKRYGV